MAVRFDSAADRLLRTANLPNANSAYTVMGWFYLVSDLNTNGALISINDNAGSNLDSILLSSDGTTLILAVAQAGSAANPTGTNLATGTWYHIAMVRTSSTQAYCYVNGVQDISDTTSVGARGQPNSRMEFGGLFAANLYRADARVAAIKVWDVGLTAAEVANEMRTIRPHRRDSLNIWSPCFPGSGERTRDYSGNGRDWTASGTLTDEAEPPLSWGAAALLYPVTTAAGGDQDIVASALDGAVAVPTVHVLLATNDIAASAIDGATAVPTGATVSPSNDVAALAVDGAVAVPTTHVVGAVNEIAAQGYDGSVAVPATHALAYDIAALAVDGGVAVPTTHVLAAEFTIVAQAKDSDFAAGLATVLTGQEIVAQGHDGSATPGQPALAYVVGGAGVDGGVAVPTVHIVSTESFIVGNGLDGSVAPGVPGVTADNTIVAQGKATDAAFGSATVSPGEATIVAQGIPDGSAVGLPFVDGGAPVPPATGQSKLRLSL